MTTPERHALATQRAEAYAPRPTGGSLMAGLCGLVLAVLADISVSGFYGWELREHLALTAILAACGFATGFGSYKLAVRKSRRAQANELSHLADTGVENDTAKS